MVPGGRTANLHAEQLGIGLVILGVIVMLGGIWHYLHVARAIDEGNYRRRASASCCRPPIVALIGGASLVWLLL